jgi:branched-chain amino acid transport system ATP-binding protein
MSLLEIQDLEMHFGGLLALESVDPQIREVEVCRALASAPRLLLLDEPTAGMSPEEIQQLMNDIRKARDSIPRMTIVIIEHDMAVIAGVSERVACLSYGERIALGTFEEVSAHPKVRAAYLGGEVLA